jgi:2-oxoglutarate ferredoxin oxidoreductase subunit alpha
VVTSNLNVARAAYDYAAQNFGASFPWKLHPIPGGPRMVINGNQAIALGAIAGGVKFMSAYPMTPASSIIEYLSAQANRFGILTKQTEDELAAILQAIGAAHAGVRAMTATSGGGFCLMVEALGLAGMTETPVVIVLAQRGGPSTGLPTRTEQSDLEFVLHASHGEFPRIVLAPGTIEQCFAAGWRAFNLAEKYQTPVIIMTDLMQAFSQRTVEPSSFDLSAVHIDRGLLLGEQDLNALSGEYLRHRITPSGISPRATPGHPKAVYITTGDEHTEAGFITEDIAIRNAQMEKRMRKLAAAVNEIADPAIYGHVGASLTLLGWGSTYGAIREATDRLNAEGISTNFIHFFEIWPLPVERVSAILENCSYVVDIEVNYTGQLANVLREYTGFNVHKRILKYDGRPFSPEEIVSRVKNEVMAHV